LAVFESEEARRGSDGRPAEDDNQANPSGEIGPSGPVVAMRARIAVYDNMLSAPRIIDIEPAPLLLFIEDIAVETYQMAQQLGGRLPYTAIREIAENFIHANFKECTVSILDNGDTIRFSDRGPGIEKKLLVLQPGVTSADDSMRRYIKGVGSGFPIVREFLTINQGSLRIDDNATQGVVVTLSLKPSGDNDLSMPSTSSQAFEQPLGQARPGAGAYPEPEASSPEDARPVPDPADRRFEQALRVIAELGAAGPTDLVGPLAISAATAHRLLESLESAGLLEKTANRKRILSNAGLSYLRKAGGY